MRIVGEDLETALKCWHPQQHVNVYCTLLGEFRFNADIADIDPEEDDGFAFAEPVDKNGQPCKPRLKDE